MGGEEGRNWKEQRERNYNQDILCDKKSFIFNKRKKNY